MLKRLGIVFAVQTSIFTIATGYDQLTQGELQAFLQQEVYSTRIAIILFWIIPLVVTMFLEGAVWFWKWFTFFVKNKYFFWQLRKRKIPNLSDKELLRFVHSANQRGLLKLDEMEKLEKIVKSLNNVDIFLLEFLDDPFAIFTQGALMESQEQKGTCYSLFHLTFPFISKRMEEFIKPSILRLYQLELITINFDDFKAKIQEKSQGTYCTSSLGHKLTFLIKKASSYS